MPSFNRSRPAPEDLLLQNGNGSSTATATGNEAIARIYAVYRDELHTHARRLLGSHDLADDAVQQAFSNTIVAVRGGASIDHAARWLHTSVRNACIDHLREQTMLSLKEAEEVPVSVVPADVVDAKERVEAVRHAVRQLPEHLRAALVLTDVHGFSYQEVASHMHKSVASVRQLIFRARRHVREMTASGGLAFGLPVRAWLSSLGERVLGGVAQAAVPVGGALLITAAVAVQQEAKRPVTVVGIHAIPAIYDAREHLVDARATETSDSARVSREAISSAGSSLSRATAPSREARDRGRESGPAVSSPAREGRQLSRKSPDHPVGPSGASLAGADGGAGSAPPLPAPPTEGFQPPEPDRNLERTGPRLSEGAQGGGESPGGSIGPQVVEEPAASEGPENVAAVTVDSANEAAQPDGLPTDFAIGQPLATPAER